MHQVTTFLKREMPEKQITESDDIDSSRDDIIYVSLRCLRQLEENREFQLGATKRTGKGINAARLPYACLACSGYSVNHEDMKSFGYDEIGKTWEFIETISTASHEATRSMMRRLRQGRSLEGYRLHMGMMETRYLTKPVDDISREIRNLGSVLMHSSPVGGHVIHSIPRIVSAGNSLALRSSLRLGLPPPPLPHHLTDAPRDETETLYSVGLSSSSRAPL